MRPHPRAGHCWLWIGSLVFSALAFAQQQPAQDRTTPPPVSREELKQANDLVQVGAYAEADKALVALQQAHPDDSGVLLLRGEVLLALGQAPAALPILQHCAEVAPRRPRVNFQLATALEKSGNPEAALEAYAKEIEVNSQPQVQVLAHVNRSLLLERKKDGSGAVAELEAVLSLDPARTQVYGDIATLQIQAGLLDEAAASLDRGLKAGFRSASHYHSLAGRYYEKKAYDSAISAFGKALEIDPTFADAELGLGGALDQLGRTGEAADHLQRYLDLRPAGAEAAQVRGRLKAIRGH